LKIRHIRKRPGELSNSPGCFLCVAVGLLGLALRRGWPSWSLALGRTGLFFWLTYLPMSLWVMQLFWGGFYFDEPRWRVPFTFAVVAVLLQVGLWLLNTPDVLTCLGNLGFGAALWWNTLNAEAILHPESPVMNSNSPRIQVFFAVLVLLSLLFGAQLAALLHRSGEEKPVALKRATQKDFTAKKRRARR